MTALDPLQREVRQDQQTGHFMPKPILGRPRLIGPAQEATLLTRLQAAPAEGLVDHCAWWAAIQGVTVSVATMHCYAYPKRY